LKGDILHVDAEFADARIKRINV